MISVCTLSKCKHVACRRWADKRRSLSSGVMGWLRRGQAGLGRAWGRGYNREYWNSPAEHSDSIPVLSCTDVWWPYPDRRRKSVCFNFASKQRRHVSRRLNGTDCSTGASPNDSLPEDTAAQDGRIPWPVVIHTIPKVWFVVTIFAIDCSHECDPSREYHSH